MNLMDLLGSVGASDSIDKMAGSVGIDSAQAQNLVGALAPALMRGLQKQTESSGDLANLQRALATGDHQRYIDEPELMQSSATRDDGNKILGHLFGSKDVSRNVAAKAAAETGIDPNLIKKALPLVAGMAMGALSKKGPSNNLGDLLDSDGDGFGMDDVLGLAKRFF
jgi:hypothetical protein